MADAIIVTYRSAAFIDACFEPLLQAGLHVIVVDNAETADAVRERFPGVELIANSENVGFAAAVNQGLARSCGDVVLLVNPDCVVPPTTVEALVSYLRENPDVAVAGPRLRDPDGTIAFSASPTPTFTMLLTNSLFIRAQRALPRALTRLLARSRSWASYEACLQGTRPTEVAWLTGACLAVRGSFLRDEIGGLDAGYFMYFEDADACLRAWQHGHRVVYLPTVEAQHVGGGSSGHRGLVEVIATRSTLRFHARHRPRTFELVRLALLARAGAGLALGIAQDVRKPDSAQMRAWLNVMSIVVTASKRTLRA